jgi:YHS domain-containing protein
MKSLLHKITAGAFLALALLSSVHAAPPVNTLSGGLFDRQTGTAIMGYDPVAYFTENKPVKGKEEFATEWHGAKWLFASKANMDLFKANPDKYAPQYGGYCAYGVAIDNLVSIEPDKFTIINGKLYLNYDADIQSTWRKSPEKYIGDADKKFTNLLKK